MPAYQYWLDRTLDESEWLSKVRWLRPLIGRRYWSVQAPAEIERGRLIALADYEPCAELLDAHLGGPPTWIVMPAEPCDPIDAVRYARYRERTSPIAWDPQIDDAIRSGADTIALLLPLEKLRRKMLVHMSRLGIRRALLLTERGIESFHPLALAGLLASRRLAAPLLPARDRRDQPRSTDECRDILVHAAPSAVTRIVPPGGKLRIAHYIYSLNSGGAERQACNAAIAQTLEGHEARVLLREPPLGTEGHYLPLLAPHQIEAYQAGSRWSEDFCQRWRERGIDSRALTRLPRELQQTVVDLTGELLTRPVDVLHCYVDNCNIPGLIAARLAGVPAVILSMRNGAPTHFAGIDRPWLKPWYELAPELDGAVFLSNSRGGAADYERWLQMPVGQIPVIHNAFRPPPSPNADQIAALRSELQLQPEQPVIAGVFRLAPEKRPLTFLNLVATLHRRLPALRVLMAGIGILEERVREEIVRLGLQEVVTLLGQRRDVHTILAISDVLLLVSEWEGTPNAVIEAQSLGCVPVVTNSGGSAEAIQPGVTGLLYELDDLKGIAIGAEELLCDESRRERMARAGRALVEDRFDPETIHRRLMAFYEQVLAAKRPPRPSTPGRRAKPLLDRCRSSSIPIPR